jgi:ABC-2 type transport system permease protein
MEPNEMEITRSPMQRLSANLRLFFQGAYLSYVALFTWFAPWNYLASKIIMPLGQILFFTFLGTYATGQANADFYIIGNAVQLAAISGVYGVTMSIGGDRWSGTLPYLFGAPANRLTIFVGRAAIHVVDGMLGVGIGLAWGALLLGLDLSHTDPLALVLTILVTAFSTSGLGLMLGSLSLITVNVMFVNNMVYFMLLIFSGSNLDLSKLPAVIQAISQAIPLTRSIASARLIIAGGSLAEVGPLLLQEIGIGLVYATIGYVMFRWFEIQAKKRGTLEVV